MMKAKIGIGVINYGRPAVFRLWCHSIDRLRKECGWFPVVCVSEREDAALCRKHDVHHIYQPNNPASEKWNTGMKWLLTQDVDYMMIVGSDDIVSTDLFRTITAETDKGIDMIGVTKIYFYCTFGKYRGMLLHFVAPRILGVCKTIKRSIIEQLQGNVCTNNKNWNMDASIHKNITPFVTSESLVDGMVTDCKSSKSLNHFSFWLSKVPTPLDANIFYDTLSAGEKAQLGKIQ